MRLEDLFAAWRKILTISEKPEPDEYKLLLKITFGGLFLAGGIGFVVYTILTIVQGVGHG